MEKKHIILGHEYAIREPPTPGAELQHVKIIAHIRRDHWRAEWIEPNPGLVDFVRSASIIVPWKERRAFLRDEKLAEELARFNSRTFPGDNHPVASAVGEIFDCTAEGCVFWHGELRVAPESLERISARAGVPVPTHPSGYVDRHGELHLPYVCAVELAQAFAAAEPRTVLDPIEVQERKWREGLRTPGREYMADLLTDWRGQWALVRQWAGHDQAVAAREERIEELERMLVQVLWDLRRPDVDPLRVADRISRALGHR